MHLKKNEVIVKVFYHHPFPFVVKVLKILVTSFPFFLFAFFFRTVLSFEYQIVVYFVISFVFGLFIFNAWLLFFLDKLVVTNSRILHIDWKNIFSRQEKEVELKDIQDIETREKGFLSSLKIFDFGLFRVETASSKAPIVFEDAFDPEGIKHFIYHLEQKPSKIEPILFSTFPYDTAREHSKKEGSSGSETHFSG